MTKLVEPSGDTIFPPELKAREWWVNWVLAYRHDELEDGEPVEDATPTKQPVAPYQQGDAEPCLWHSGLDDDEHPSTDYETVSRWRGVRVGLDVPAPERVISDELGVGIIIPVGGGDGEPVTLVDWDDVRDPETGEVHPLCAHALEQAGGWAEVSQSGEGVHQFIFGEIPGGLKKYIRYIDDEPFVGDDLPAVEMYQSGRLTAMTGRHIEGCGTEIPEGQELITELVDRTAAYGNASSDAPTNPLADDSDDYEPSSAGDVGDALRAEIAYDGEHPDDWDVGADESVKYAAALRGRERSDELPSTANWELIGYIAALGKELGKSQADVLADLKAHPTPQYGYDARRAKKEVRSMWRKMQNGNVSAPNVATLKRRGMLPDDYVDVDELESDDTLSPEQKWEAWADARRSGELTADAWIPDGALEHIARREQLYDFDALPDDYDELPTKAANWALNWVNRWGREEEDVETDDNGYATGRRGKAPDAGTVWTWEDVRYIFDEDKEAGRLAAEKVLRDDYHFLTVEETDTLRVYDDQKGIFTDRLAEIRGEIHEGLGKFWTRHEKDEVLARLRQRNVVPASTLDATGEFDEPHICVANGVLNLFTGELKEHSPEYRFVTRHPIQYDPDANTSAWEGVLEDWTRREEDRKAMLEMAGHALVPDANQRYKKFMLLYGGADNGKTIFLNGVSALLNGPEAEENNVSNVTLKKLAENRFAANSIYGNSANIAGEIEGKKITATGAIKNIPGGDRVEIEPKGQPSFFDHINATLMFAANDPPILGERDKAAIASRLVPVELPYTFVQEPEGPMEKQRVPKDELRDELHSEEALSGLLKLAMEGVQRLEENNGDVSLPEDDWERLKQYETQADPMREFAHECLENEDGDYIVKEDVTTIYKAFCGSQGYEIGSNVHQILHRVLRSVPGLNYAETRPNQADYGNTDLPLTGWTERKTAVDRVTLTEEGLAYAEQAGLVDKSEQDADDGLPLTPADVTPGVAGKDGSLPTLEAVCTTTWENEYGRHAGRLQGEDGEGIDFTAVGGVELEAGVTYTIERAKIQQDNLGVLKLQLDPSSNITRGTAEPSTDGGDAAAATDGGAQQSSLDEDRADDPADERYQPPETDHGVNANAERAAREVLTREDGDLPAPGKPELMTALVDQHDHMAMEDAEAAIEKARELGHIVEGSKGYELTD
jgi:P4 family phage/plasmid primase-like protien